MLRNCIISDNVYYNLGEAYLEKKDFNNAISAFSNAITLAPDKYENVFPNKGNCYLKRAQIYYENFKDIKRAINDLESSYRFSFESSGSPMGFWNLVTIYETQKDYTSAIQVCNRDRTYASRILTDGFFSC